MMFFFSIFPAPRNGAMYRVDGPEAIADAIFALFLIFFFDYVFIHYSSLIDVLMLIIILLLFSIQMRLCNLLLWYLNNKEIIFNINK